MWNGSCIVDSSIVDKHIHKQDQAPSDLDYNTTFKIALLLYAVRVTDYPMSQEEFRAIEDHLWSRQLENGGIAALATGDGRPMGSANCETTAMTLLIYNHALISDLKNGIAAPEPAPFHLFAYVILIVVVKYRCKSASS